MSIGLLVLVAVTLLGIFLSIALFFKDESVGVGSWLLGTLCFLHTIYFLEFAMIFTKQLHHIPHFTGISYGIPFLIGPVAWAYAKTCTGSKFSYTGVYLLHFVPFLWLCFLQLGLYLDYGYMKEKYVLDLLYSGQFYANPKHLWITIFQVLSMLFYTFLIVYEVFQGSSARLFREGKTWVTARMKSWAKRFAFWTILFMLSLIAWSAGETFKWLAFALQIVLCLHVFFLTAEGLLGRNNEEKWRAVEQREKEEHIA